MRKALPLIAVIFLLSLSLFHSVRVYDFDQARATGIKNTDRVTNLNCVYDYLKDLDTRKATYIYTVDGSYPFNDDPELMKPFQLAQNILAPVVLEPTLGHEVIVANLKNTEELKQASELLNLTLLVDCGDGVGLLSVNKP